MCKYKHTAVEWENGDSRYVSLCICYENNKKRATLSYPQSYAPDNLVLC